MKEVARIALPSHGADGEFDHAAVDAARGRLYVAHPSNDAVEVVDLDVRRHLRSLPGLKGVAGVWVSEQRQLLFTSNRGEDTASVFAIDGATERQLSRVATGSRPNGMAFDARRGLLMVAGVGNPQRPNAPPTLTFVEAESGEVRGQLTAPGRTRWALYHAPTDCFYVNVADPPSILAIAARDPSTIARVFPVPAKGPHGLEQDPDGERLYCACDDGKLVSLEVGSGVVRPVSELSGPPDVLWVNPRRRRLYAAVGDPGCVDVFDLGRTGRSGTTVTSFGAHTLTVDSSRDLVHVFLPASHDDLVLEDSTP